METTNTARMQLWNNLYNNIVSEPNQSWRIHLVQAAITAFGPIPDADGPRFRALLQPLPPLTVPSLAPMIPLAEDGDGAEGNDGATHPL